VEGGWGVRMLTFEILFGRLVVGASWERIASDYDVLEGGLMPFEIVVLVLSSLIAGRCGAWCSPLSSPSVPAA
jgi:hypothetical protein